VRRGFEIGILPPYPLMLNGIADGMAFQV